MGTTRNGNILSTTLVSEGDATSEDFIPRNGAESVALLIKAEGACEVDAYEVYDLGGAGEHLFHCFDGEPQGVVGGEIGTRLVIQGPVRRLRVVVTDTSVAENDVEVRAV